MTAKLVEVDESEGRIELWPSDESVERTGLILDTGDNLHFGLARLMAHSAGNSNVELVVVGDDVSVPHSRGKMVGRRCLAGITLGMSPLLSTSC